MKNLKIGTKLILGFGINMVLLVILGTVAYYSLIQIERGTDILRDHAVEIEAIGDMQVSLSQVVMPVNDYIITADPKYRGKFDEVSQRLSKQIAKMEQIGLTQEEKDILNKIKENFAKIKEVSREILAMEVKGAGKVAAKKMEEIDYKYAYPMVEAAEGLNVVAHKHMDSEVAAIAALKRSVNTLVILMTLLGVVLAGMLSVVITRSITRPVRKLVDVTNMIAAGDLSRRSDVTSRDEIGELATSFDSMADSIQNKNEELQTFNEELQTSNEELKSTNEEMEAANEELREAHEKLIQQEKLAAVGQLASGVGHELRNPLGVMKNAVYYIKTKVPQDDEKIAKHLRILSKEIDNSTKIISDLLGFSRTRKPAISPNDIHRVIEEALSTMEVPSNVRIAKELDTKLPQAMVDPDQIRQVFLNILLNAVQAMNEGGMLTIGTRVADSAIEIQFKDTGSGIPQENIKKLFDPFFTTKSRGIGLGLAVSHGIIERNKGTIEVQSTVGQGTTFIVTLPAIG